MVRVKHGKDTIISNKLVAEAYVSLSEWQKHARWHGECSHANAHTACGIWCGMLARKHTMLHVASGVACLHANAHGACGKLACCVQSALRMADKGCWFLCIKLVCRGVCVAEQVVKATVKRACRHAYRPTDEKLSCLKSN
eukprot:1161938-Pelagomonas_calceolata.AAC.2